jgi:BirA family biotin operon repressor/biotin-[acetyl-CoA-carboxylase] ligase
VAVPDLRSTGVDLGEERLAMELPGRPVRSYAALVATHADALAWARADAPAGAVVTADYQAAPRGRGGLEWTVRPGVDLGFSLVLRPELSLEREGWLYPVAGRGLADAVTADEVGLTWPDELHGPAGRLAALAVHAELGPEGVDWAVLTVLFPDAGADRPGQLGAAVHAIERRLRSEPGEVLADYRARCTTLGQRVRARLVPVGPAGPEILGEAVDCLDDGALVLATDRGHRVGVRPQHLGLLEAAC